MTPVDFGKCPRIWLDRLVSGDLDESLRCDLLAWLDLNPSCWRDCAMAFLEAQVWHESAAISMAGVELGEHLPRDSGRVPSPRSVEPAAAHRIVRAGRVAAWSSLGLLAASLLLAFALGMTARDWRKTSKPGRIAEEDSAPGPATPMAVMATVGLSNGGGTAFPAELRIPVVPVSNPATPPTGPPLSDYERQKWQRRGYSIERERRFLPAQLPDGTKVVLPVEQLKASYVGSKIS